MANFRPRIPTMKRLIASPLFLAAMSAFAASPAPAKISNEDAASLYGALSSIKDGLTTGNISAAGEDIWILKPAAESFGTQQNKLSIALSRANANQQAANGPPINPSKSQAAIDDAEKANKDWDDFRNGDAKIPVALVPLTAFTDQELRDAKISPATLSLIQHYLFPPK